MARRDQTYLWFPFVWVSRTSASGRKPKADSGDHCGRACVIHCDASGFGQFLPTDTRRVDKDHLADDVASAEWVRKSQLQRCWCWPRKMSRIALLPPRSSRVYHVLRPFGQRLPRSVEASIPAPLIRNRAEGIDWIRRHGSNWRSLLMSSQYETVVRPSTDTLVGRRKQAIVPATLPTKVPSNVILPARHSMTSRLESFRPPTPHW